MYVIMNAHPHAQICHGTHIFGLLVYHASHDLYWPQINQWNHIDYASVNAWCFSVIIVPVVSELQIPSQPLSETLKIACRLPSWTKENLSHFIPIRPLLVENLFLLSHLHALQRAAWNGNHCHCLHCPCSRRLATAGNVGLYRKCLATGIMGNDYCLSTCLSGGRPETGL